MRGLLWKSICETRALCLLAAAGMLAVTALLTFILPQLQEGLSTFILQMPFIRKLISALMGIDLEGGLTTRLLLSIIWTHPVVLAITWGFAISFATRVPAGEIDRGTIDFLLGWPVTRRDIHIAESSVGLVSAAIVVAMGAVGYSATAGSISAEMRPDIGCIGLALVNLFCTVVAVGGLAQLVSALSDRRPRAVAIVLTIVLGSFLLSFLGQFWEPAKRVEFLSISHYYQPTRILTDGRLSASDIAVLLTFGVVSGTLGCIVFSRRNICTA